MFFSIPYPDLGLIVHARWDDDGTWSKLYILAELSQATLLLSKLPPDEALELKKHLEILKSYTQNTSVEIEGDVALSLGNFLANMRNNFSHYMHVPGGPELLGFWEPPSNRMPGDGIIMWFLGGNYYVAIVSSKNQARNVVKELWWLGEERQKKLSAKIATWNSRQDSEKRIQRIEGAPAVVLCRASVVRKMPTIQRPERN